MAILRLCLLATTLLLTGFIQTGNAADKEANQPTLAEVVAARSDEDRAYLNARQAVLAERETHAIGVDTDGELQSLILVEQSYAANARVLTVVDTLMKLLLEA